ncbi:DUF4920 domain-containing protein [Dokdonella sp.]|uniref:DUF4920 domain-containing protein n=1 Tax=Dokdonella sp. TaxID=2291710 RepID=UPI0031C2D558|nr:DUF4920 domain-containing protein [Dokdonella sp.]
MRIFAFLLLSTAAMLAHAAQPASYGQAFADGPAVSVATAVAAFDSHAGEPQRFSGRITEVCQARGCWMMLEDDGVAARVMFGDHAFFLPKDAKGAAVVHGVLSRKELTPEQVEHFNRDGGKGALVEPVEYRIVADGVRVEGA